MSGGGTVATNEDNAIELTLYRKNGVRPSSQRPTPDVGVQVESGDVPPVAKEVISIGHKSVYLTLANPLTQEKKQLYLKIFIPHVNMLDFFQNVLPPFLPGFFCAVVFDASNIEIVPLYRSLLN